MNITKIRESLNAELKKVYGDAEEYRFTFVKDNEGNVTYWTDKVNPQNIITKLDIEDYVYTQKKDKTGLWHVTIYAK